jgi:excisionase family DNA binding protein
MSLNDYSDDDLLTIPEAAQALRVSDWTLYRNKERMGIPTVRIKGSVRIRAGSLRAWIHDNEADSLAGTPR